jgi:Secretion system C-terminal sorting domain
MNRIFTLVIACSLFCSFSTAQTFPYEFSVLSDPYYDLTAPISISDADVWDDPFYITSTGFEVTLFDVVTNTLGIISPGSQVINLNEANPDTVQVLMPYMADIMNANDSTAVSPISYQLEGPPGNAVYKLEWKNVGFYGEWNASYSYFNTTNFQLWIYQNSGVIEFRYGPNTIKSGSLLHFFGTGPLVLLGENVAFDGSGWQGLWALGGDPQNPTISAIPSGQQPLPEQCLSGEPQSGTVYRFAPIVASNTELQPELQLRAWPSPTTDYLTISIKPNTSYSIYDIAGKLMVTRTATDFSERLDIRSWPAGQYCIKGSNTSTIRFIKQ